MFSLVSQAYPFKPARQALDAPLAIVCGELDSQACLVKNRGMTRNQHVDAEPTAAELAAIDVEWPLIDAELAVMDAEIRALSAAGGPSPLDWRRLRRAERRVLAARVRLAAVPDVPGVA